MAILVDELREYPDAGLRFTVWCHMATDGSFEELHEFAARLGLRRAWFQRDHYDLPAHGRAAAVALGAEEMATSELLLRMAGPRGDRARRRSLAPSGGVAWLRGGGGPAVLRYPAGALVVIGGPSGAGKSTLAARAVERVPVLDPDGTRAALGPATPWGEALAAWHAELRASLASGEGAVAVTTALRHGHRLGLARAASQAGVTPHLVMLDADAETCRAGRATQGEERVPDGLFEHLIREWEAFRRDLAAAGDPSPFDSITILDRAAADRVRRIALSPSSQG
jgi:predicted kinase